MEHSNVKSPMFDFADGHCSLDQGRLWCNNQVYLVQDMRIDCSCSVGLGVFTEVERSVVIRSIR